MAPSDDFRAALLRRVQTYRVAEERAERRLLEVSREAEAMRERRQAAEKLFAAEFGDVPSNEIPADAPLGSTETQSARAGDPVSSPDGPLGGLPWEEAITRILSSEGPLHVKEIWRRLEAGGFRTGARDPLRSIVAVAIRSPRIGRARPNTYGLTESSPG
jgi:hypothetical protein